MEQKKELLIKVLKKLIPHWDLAEGVLALVESGSIDDQTIDGVIHILAQSIKKLQNKEDTTKLQKSLEKIQQIKMLEDEEKISEENLDALLADI